jgi:hypothetical protein
MASVMLAGTEILISSAAWSREAVNNRLAARVVIMICNRFMVAPFNGNKNLTSRQGG